MKIYNPNNAKLYFLTPLTNRSVYIFGTRVKNMIDSIVSRGIIDNIGIKKKLRVLVEREIKNSDNLQEISYFVRFSIMNELASQGDIKNKVIKNFPIAKYLIEVLNVNFSNILSAYLVPTANIGADIELYNTPAEIGKICKTVKDTILNKKEEKLPEFINDDCPF